MKSPQERFAWIKEYLEERTKIRKQNETVDVLNRYFVDDYVEFSGAQVAAMPYGADKCPRLGSDLRKMHRQGILKRSRTGIQGMSGMGFPKWVWSYELAQLPKVNIMCTTNCYGGSCDCGYVG